MACPPWVGGTTWADRVLTIACGHSTVLWQTFQMAPTAASHRGMMCTCHVMTRKATQKAIATTVDAYVRLCQDGIVFFCYLMALSCDAQAHYRTQARPCEPSLYLSKCVPHRSPMGAQNLTLGYSRVPTFATCHLTDSKAFWMPEGTCQLRNTLPSSLYITLQLRNTRVHITESSSHYRIEHQDSKCGY